MITRFLQPTIEKALTRTPAIAVLGPRQVGKTTLAKTIAKSRASSLYLDVENPQDRRKLEDAYTYLHSLGNVCVSWMRFSLSRIYFLF
jgi:predicted AAA+ superfamily ATPase